MLICIDPGHGGNDPGAVVSLPGEVTYTEKAANLTASMFLAGVLSSKGHEVRLTRSRDNGLALHERCSKANDWHSDLFISVHHNSAESDQARGFEVFHYDGSENGFALGNRILEAVRPIIWVKIHGEGVKSAGFHVLKYTRMPAVLLELGFISNNEDRANIREIYKLFELIRVIGMAV